MNTKEMKSLVIGNLRAKLPIIQGGMGIGISLSGLASSVANQGGIGVIAAAGVGMAEPDYYSNFQEANIRALKEQIQKARELSSGIIGVNIMVALSDFSDMVKTAVKEKIDIIFSGAGLPLDLPKFLDRSQKTKLVPIVSSGRAAKIITKNWKKKYDYIPDAIVVEGPEAGGHLGFKAEQLDNPDYALGNLVKDVLGSIKPFEQEFGKKIPVIAAGGIYTGKDIYDMMELGASGVQMATRFVTTEECDASPEFKECYIRAQQKDIDIINSPVGMPGRAIINNFIKSINAGKKSRLSAPITVLLPATIRTALIALRSRCQTRKKAKCKAVLPSRGRTPIKRTVLFPLKNWWIRLKASIGVLWGSSGGKKII